MAILNRILGIARGAATRRTAARPHPGVAGPRPGMGAGPAVGAGIPRSGRGLLGALLNGRRRRPM
jgi:hypothetical protein